MVNVLSGWQGVTAGGSASINLPVGQRYHRILIRCTAVNYASTASGVAQAAVKISSTAGTIGTGTVTPTIVNGVVTAATVGGTYTGTWVVGDTITYADVTGIGLVLRVATLSSSLPATFTVTTGGVAGPIDPRLLVTSIKQVVNGQIIRDVGATATIGIANHNGLKPGYGWLVLAYTEPKRNFLKTPEMNSWDLAGQGTFQLQLGISSLYTNPGLAGVMEFDYLRNARIVTADNQAYIGNGKVALGTKVPFLQPVAQHQFTYPISSGRFDITTLPFNYPISRIYAIGSTPGNIYGLDILADGALMLQTLAADNYEINGEYDFQTGSIITAPTLNGAGYGGSILSGTQGQTPATIPNGVLTSPFDGATGNQGYAWDAVYVADIAGRPWRSLNVSKSLIFRLYSNIAQNITIVVESLPGAFLG